MPESNAQSRPSPPRPPSEESRRRGPNGNRAPDPKPWRVDPAPDGRGGPTSGGPGRSPMGFGGGNVWRIVLGVLALWFIFGIVTSFVRTGQKSVRISYTPVFLQQVTGNNVTKISSKGEEISGDFRKQTDPPGDGGSAKHFTTQVPVFADRNQLSKLLQDHKVEVNASPLNQGPGLLANILVSLLPTLLIVGIFVFIARRASQAAGGLGGGGIGGIGRSKAKRVEADTTRTNFNDVAGIDEAEDELKEIVDFLKNPDRYAALGAKIPKGVLLAGQPGTGKTLLARAMAGEAHVPFFSASASEFIEMIVGVGASRVRDLFQEASKAAPAIIFIDELDAIGRARGGGNAVGGHDEREQTLNQILTEMDGFDSSVGVIVLAATNRPEILDPALLRPGRFDRRIYVQSPDRVGREKILEVHTRSVPLDSDVNLAAIAASTPGMVGADLANLVNEAALLAAKRGHKKVAEADFTDGLEKVVLGAERKVVMSDAERERTAYHESGHALVGMLTPGADPVRKVSIIPRGQALGVTLSAPDSDRFNYSEQDLRAKILVALGGRVAEEVVYGDITSGAESDIQQLTQIARGMVTRWGMSEAIGPLSVAPQEGSSPLLPGSEGVSQATQQLIDGEVRRIVEQAHEDVTALLTGARDQLESLTRALLENETLDQAEAYAAAQVELRSPVVA